MSQKYQKETSKILNRTIWFVETPGIAYKGGGLDDRYNIHTILKMRGTKKNFYYTRLVYVLQNIFYKIGMKSDKFEDYLKLLGNKKIKDSEIYIHMKKIYQTMSEHASASFDRGADRSKKIKQMLENSEALPIETYLDYGCGSGELTASIGSYLKLKPEDIHGVDIFKYPNSQGFNFKQIQSDGKIPYPDNHFDFITSSMVLHHLRDEKLPVAISEIYRVLKPGGTFIVREHNVHPDEQYEMTIILDFMHEMYDDVLSSDTAWRETSEYYAGYKSLKKWDIMLQKAGFTLNNFQLSFNSNTKFNPVAQYTRIYNKESGDWNSVLCALPLPNESYKKIDFFRTLTNKIPRVKYHRRNKDIKTTMHWGQRKLLLSEIEFLTLFYQSDTYKQNPEKPIYIIYAGASPGTHIKYLWTLFPEVFFVLYDPREFDPILNCNGAQSQHIHTHVQLFLDETASEWQSINHQDKHVLLVSDIRTAEPETMKPDEVERHIYQDNQLQKQWWQIMEPAMAMFKFRLPWDEKTTEYPKGDIFIQIVPTLTTTETRLIVYEPNAPIITYNHKDYEERMFRFNTVERSQEYDNILSEIPLDKKEGLTNQYDSVGEIYIIENYILTMNPGLPRKDVITTIVEISKDISKNLSLNRTLKCDQPLKKHMRNVVQKLKNMKEIPQKAPLTQKTYNKYVIAGYDDLVKRGIINPKLDEGGIAI
jgi:ubiquinone/menaquinone biosynthesis C-methylase UbiE